MTYSIDNLDKDQLRLIIESLLFSTSTSVNAKWYEEENKQLFDLCIYLRKKFPEILTKDVYIIDEKEYYDEYATDIIDYYPEILESKPII
jgi:AAA+ superfamily predicted ATPase